MVWLGSNERGGSEAVVTFAEDAKEYSAAARADRVESSCYRPCLIQPRQDPCDFSMTALQPAIPKPDRRFLLSDTRVFDSAVGDSIAT
jgi:hypothetical protein